MDTPDKETVRCSQKATPFSYLKAPALLSLALVGIVGTFLLIHIENLLHLTHILTPVWAVFVSVAIGLSVFSERKRMHKDTRFKAYLKHLTEGAVSQDSQAGVPNRFQYENLFSHLAGTLKTSPGIAAFILLNIDDFKSINTGFSYAVGDQLLENIRARLEKGLKHCDLNFTIRTQEPILRIGGDEFGILIENLNDTHVAGIFCQHILALIKKPFMIDDVLFNMTASAGIAVFPHATTQAEQLFKCAEMALCRAKERGGDYYQYFSERLNEAHLEQLQLAHDLKHAIQENQFHLVYQPQFRVLDRKIIGAEALLRWEHPERGSISPEKFIAIAESCGEINTIGDWVMKEAFMQWHSWKEQGIDLPKLSINLSSIQLKQKNFIDKTYKLLQKTTLSPSTVEFEITETSIMEENISAENCLDKLESKGFRLSIDDFGTGYSSLSRLKSLPVSILKIDKSFICDLSKTSGDRFILKAIIELAHRLKLSVIAEGVETKEQLEILKSLDCDALQGYLFSKPLKKDALLALIQSPKENVKIL